MPASKFDHQRSYIELWLEFRRLYGPPRDRVEKALRGSEGAAAARQRGIDAAQRLVASL